MRDGDIKNAFLRVKDMRDKGGVLGTLVWKGRRDE